MFEAGTRHSSLVPRPSVVVLAGGVGAARFLEGVVAVVPPTRVTVLSNTGDDTDFYGLRVSPDIDIVLYTLAGLVDPVRGWGLAHDSFHVLAGLRRLGEEVWFNLGDHDLAASLYRSRRLAEGATLTEVTAELAAALGLAVRVLPMSDNRIETRVQTAAGEVAFQEYFVHRRTEDDVHGLRFAGVEEADPAPGLLDAITEAEIVLLAPSNPFVSIGPLLAVAGVREALRATAAPVVAISPIVGGVALKGPAAKMLASLGHEPSAVAIARLYADFLDTLVLDEVDAALAPAVAALGVRPAVTDTIMRGRYEKTALARFALEQTRKRAREGTGTTEGADGGR